MPGRQNQLAAAVAIDGRRHYIIAAEAGMSPNTLGGILSGRVIPNTDAMNRLAAVLRVDVADLFEVAG